MSGAGKPLNLFYRSVITIKQSIYLIIRTLHDDGLIKKRLSCKSVLSPIQSTLKLTHSYMKRFYQLKDEFIVFSKTRDYKRY